MWLSSLQLVPSFSRVASGESLSVLPISESVFNCVVLQYYI